MPISLKNIQELLLPGLEMCASKGGIPATQAQAAEMARYQQLVQQSAPVVGFGFPLSSPPVVKIVARELTKEELKQRLERKLDLDEARPIAAQEIVNHGRWRQVMDEVFAEDEDGNKGGGNGSAEEGKGRGRRGDG